MESSEGLQLAAGAGLCPEDEGLPRVRPTETGK